MEPEWKEIYWSWEDMTVYERFDKNCQLFQDEMFIYSDAGNFTYGEAHEHIVSMAAYLSENGVGSGDHVGVFMRNSPAFVFLIFALSMIGAVEVPINFHVKAKEFMYILEKMDVSSLVCNLSLPDIPAEKLTGIKRIFTAGLCDIQYAEKPKRKVLPHKGDPSDLLAIFMTSGSSGHPKGVRLRHDMVLRSAYSSCLTREFEQRRRILIPIPLFHMMAYLEGVMAAMLTGNSVILTIDRFSPAVLLDALKKYEATDVELISSMMTKTLKECEVYPEDYPSLRHAFLGGNCPEWVWEKAVHGFGLADVTAAYGLTECGSTSFMTRPSDSLDTIIHTNGRLKRAGSASLTGLTDAQLEAMICDEDTGTVLPFGEAGLLCLRGATMTDGYYNDEEATKRVLSPDGWFCTGDECILREDGSLIFLGRSDDMYKINGENVSAVFVDAVMGECPHVNAVETVGIPDKDHGAVAVMFIDAVEESAEAKKAILSYIIDHLARFQRPKYIIYSSMEQWPKTDTEKISKKALRKIAADLAGRYEQEHPASRGQADLTQMFKESCMES